MLEPYRGKTKGVSHWGKKFGNEGGGRGGGGGRTSTAKSCRGKGGSLHRFLRETGRSSLTPHLGGLGGKRKEGPGEPGPKEFCHFGGRRLSRKSTKKKLERKRYGLIIRQGKNTNRITRLRRSLDNTPSAKQNPLFSFCTSRYSRASSETARTKRRAQQRQKGHSTFSGKKGETREGLRENARGNVCRHRPRIEGALQEKNCQVRPVLFV